MELIKKYIWVFLISMVPLIELRGAIPFAVGFNLPLLPSYFIAIIGNMIPVPIIFFFARKVLEWGKDVKFKIFAKFCRFCINKGDAAKNKLIKNGEKGVFVALLLFVGIPLPGTGAWTGTLAASFLDLDFKKSVISVCVGIVLAGIIMGFLSSSIFGAFNFIK